jgi:hypothetical protein
VLRICRSAQLERSGFSARRGLRWRTSRVGFHSRHKHRNGNTDGAFKQHTPMLRAVRRVRKSHLQQTGNFPSVFQGFAVPHCGKTLMVMARPMRQ